jgi:nucleotide-binding universal stress UspA family protein
MYTGMLIPLDGSKTAEKVLPYARYLADRLKMPVELLAVIDIAELAAQISAEKARFLDTIIEDGFGKVKNISQESPRLSRAGESNAPSTRVEPRTLSSAEGKPTQEC